jgi:O-antigen ligase
MIKPLDWRHGQRSLTVSSNPVEAGESAGWLSMIWLLGTLLLLPVELIDLPLNIALVDCWILLLLPFFLLQFVRGQHVISLAYTVAMGLILVASLASTFGAVAPSNSFVVMLKEVYVYIWFVTLTAVLAKLNDRDLRRLLLFWIAVVFLHGCLLIGQFLSPALWRFTASFADSWMEFELYRPSGLFVNANWAAFFQLLGFVPIALVRPSKTVGVILGLLLLPTILITGSLGASVAFIAGLLIAVMVIALCGYFVTILKILGQLTIVILFVGGILYFAISQNQRYQAHFDHIFFGRVERSSGGRFALWERGINTFLEQDVFLWGIGPENFREIDVGGKHLHNDFLAFSVERGLLGTLGLVLFALVAISRAVYLILLYNKHPDPGRIVVVVFLAVMVAT